MIRCLPSLSEVLSQKRSSLEKTFHFLISSVAHWEVEHRKPKQTCSGEGVPHPGLNGSSVPVDGVYNKRLLPCISESVKVVSQTITRRTVT